MKDHPNLLKVSVGSSFFYQIQLRQKNKWSYRHILVKDVLKTSCFQFLFPNWGESSECRPIHRQLVFSMLKLPAFRLSKTVKVQPTNEFDLKNSKEEVENLESHEYSLKGTCGGSRPSTRDVASIERLRKEVKLLRVLVGAFIVVSVISFVLNIWIIHKDGTQNKPQNEGKMECLWLNQTRYFQFSYTYSAHLRPGGN